MCHLDFEKVYGQGHMPGLNQNVLHDDNCGLKW